MFSKFWFKKLSPYAGHITQTNELAELSKAYFQVFYTPLFGNFPDGFSYCLPLKSIIMPVPAEC